MEISLIPDDDVAGVGIAVADLANKGVGKSRLTPSANMASVKPSDTRGFF